MGTANAEGVSDEIHSLIFISKISLTGMDSAIVFAEEVPAKDEVIDQIFHNSAGHPQMATIDAELDVNDTLSIHSFAINANGSPLVGFDLLFIQVGVAT